MIVKRTHPMRAKTGAGAFERSITRGLDDINRGIAIRKKNTHRKTKHQKKYFMCRLWLSLYEIKSLIVMARPMEKLTKFEMGMIGIMVAAQRSSNSKY